MLELVIAVNVACDWFLGYSLVTQIKNGGERSWKHGFLLPFSHKICWGSRKSTCMHNVGVFSEHIFVKICIHLVYCINNDS